ncbi:UDP-N-acetylmuramoyl-tripeptide--D-alanyl-D-alanine ligase [Hirschia maritima]|uniref:UDP-N-acetylmuramoyl-tripeptide--D-alanyl-D- alanine ligase n=1 Tax=Hirschia maritima TaxID=1121961 RepID=UPI00036C7F00|nr:UDP-N-acetylmuramoyl-tripeptide--D-alanyl-D-alanine ligase [Hirschia maritima]
MVDTLWTAQEIADAAGGVLSGDWAVSGISIDSREVAKGDLFVALKDQRDGHEYVGMSLEKGAAGALVSKDDMGVPCVKTDDTLEALVNLGLAARERSNAIHAAITGSVGKTSVKEMIAQIFRSKGKAHWNVKSFNNHFGVPLTLARMPRDTKRAIFEIGMNTPGEIAPRSRMVRPQIALVTKIAGAHLEGMGTIEAVADEKSDIFCGLEPNGVAILPREDAFFDYMKARAFDAQPTASLLSFGSAGSEADARLLSFEADGNKSRGTADILGEEVSFELDAIGEHWGLNAVLAILVGRLSGMTAQEAADGLKGYRPPAGRGAAETLKMPFGEITLLDDAYNANPESMRAGLAALGQRDGRKIAILGEMKELGPDADKLHAELKQPILDAGVSELFLAGDGLLPLRNNFHESQNEPGVCWTSTSKELLLLVNKSLISGDVVLIKGSNASGIATIANALREVSLSEEGRVNQMSNSEGRGA